MNYCHASALIHRVVGIYQQIEISERNTHFPCISLSQQQIIGM